MPASPARRDRRLSAVRRGALRSLVVVAVAVAASASGFDDPVGDTFGEGPDQHDLTRFLVESDGRMLVLELAFASPVSRWDSGQADALRAVIDLDLDRNPTTGGISAVDAYAAQPAGLGAERSIQLGPLDEDPPASARLVDLVTGEVKGEPEVRFLGHAVVVLVPLELLGGGDGGLAAAAVVGTLDEATDAVPDGGALESIDSALRLLDHRFRAEVSWQDHAGNVGMGHVVPLRSPDAGLFWFFHPDNWELQVKVLDGCPVNGRVWVFAAATTDVRFALTVLDTASGASVTYENPLGRASAAITDTAAFDACP